jgi:TRAP transporter TAXI family solute receptor
MRRFRDALLPLLLAAAVGIAEGPGGRAMAQELKIGTGSEAGVYYHLGRSLCRVVTDIAKVADIACVSEPTAGSIFNLQALRAGELSLAVAQSDWQYHAVKGSKVFSATGADESLRALFSVHSEAFTLVVGKDSGITSIEGLKGRRVNLGNPGSGQRATMDVVMDALGWTIDDFALANELPPSQQSVALCHERIEAMIYMVGHPNPSVSHATGKCEARIAPVQGPAIDALVAKYPYYAMTEIPGGIYPGNDEPVATFGVLATVVASSALSEETVYRFVSAVFENLDRLKRMHPAFGSLEPSRMIRDGLTAPLHPGAERYYREKGWL